MWQLFVKSVWNFSNSQLYRKKVLHKGSNELTAQINLDSGKTLKQKKIAQVENFKFKPFQPVHVERMRLCLAKKNLREKGMTT